MTKQYDPQADSTDHIAGTGHTGPYLVVEPGKCHCGCTLQVNKGKRFRQGHDARFKGILIRAHLAGADVTIHNGSIDVTTAAARFAQDYAWEHYLRDAQYRAEVKVAKSTLRKGGTPDKIPTKITQISTYDAKTGERYEFQGDHEFTIAGGRKVTATCVLISGGKASFTYSNSKGEEKVITRKVTFTL